MKRIGLLGGTSWPSTLEYYRMLNEKVSQRIGDYHSADIILRSIDYDPIKRRYETAWDEIPLLLEAELRLMLALPIDGLILCNNTLHKAFDLIRHSLPLTIPFFHVIELTAATAKKQGLRRLLLLATRFTMGDGFFARGLEKAGLEISLPDAKEWEEIQAIQSRIAAGEMRPEFSDYFTKLLARHASLDAVVLACTELPLAIRAETSPLPILDPMRLQVEAALDFMLA